MTITHKGHPLFLWTNSHLTLGCPAGLSSSLMCSPQPLLPALLPLLPRRPGQHLPDGAPPRRRQFLRHGAPASSVLPATSQLPRRPDQQQLSHHGAPAGQQLPDGAPPRRLGQQRPASNISAATAPRQASSRWRSATAPRPAKAPLRLHASNNSATAPLPATNLIRRRRVLRFG